MKLFKNLLFLVLVLLPAVSLAAPFGGIKSMLTEFRGLVKLALPIAFALALLFFFWGVAKYILKAGDAKAREEGRGIMVWGVIALFVLVSVWGIVGFIQDQLGIKGNNATSGSVNGGGYTTDQNVFVP